MSDKDIIYRQAAIDSIQKDRETSWKELENDNVEYRNGCDDGYAYSMQVISELPSAQRKKGKWIERESGTEDKENGFDTVIVCSCCDFPATTFYSEDCESRTQIRTDFCPNCGANMRGE